VRGTSKGKASVSCPARFGSPLSDQARHLLAVGEVILAACIWATSFVGIRYALRLVQPLTLAGLRYTIAFLFFVPFLVRGRRALRRLPKAMWARFALMGLVQYTIGNGALFWALQWVSSTAGALTQSLAPLLTLGIETAWLRERLHPLQLAGVLVAVGGSVLFFAPKAGQGVSLGTALLLGITVTGFAVFPVLVREVARAGTVGSLALTGLPLGFGGGALLVLAFALEGLPRLSGVAWGIVLGLAVMNTTVAYLLFTHALRYLAATEANVILNLSPLGTALIAWATLGEALTPHQIGAMFVVVLGASLAQWRPPGLTGGIRTDSLSRKGER